MSVMVLLLLCTPLDQTGSDSFPSSEPRSQSGSIGTRELFVELMVTSGEEGGGLGETDDRDEGVHLL